jgi:hypothetical protein
MLLFILLATSPLQGEEDPQHLLTAKPPFLESVELEDHSIWTVAPIDVHILAYWDKNDALVLYYSPASYWTYFWYGDFNYYLYNLTQNSYVRVNFKSHPCDYQDSSCWIISLDKFSNRLFMNDGTAWKIHPDDEALFLTWSINDFIIYGKNGIPLSSYPDLLINVRRKHHIRAVKF